MIPTTVTAPAKPQKKVSQEPKEVYYPEFKEPKQPRTRETLNSASDKILSALRDPRTSPFTIGYVPALNALSKIGIMELKSKRHGDYRKFVRLDANNRVIAKLFSYVPATSKVGHEWMNNVRPFIEAQIQERPDLNIQ